MHKKIEVHIYHTSDIHGHLNSETYTEQGRLSKGLARVSSFYKSQSFEHQLKIDLGDMLQGSPLAYIYKENTQNYSHVFADVMNHMNIDYFVPGNHDFNYGVEHLNHLIEALNAKTLCSNVYHDYDLYFKYGYDIKTIENELKIGIIGITNNYIPNWEPEDHIKGLIFKRAYEQTKEIVNQIKESVDYIIVAYHGGYECNLDTGENEAKNADENLGCMIFTHIPEVDLLLTGHEHRLLVLKDKHRVMVQPGYAGSHVSHTVVQFEKEKQWRVTHADAQLVSMEDYQDDPEITDMIAPFVMDAQEKLKEVIGSTPMDLLIKDLIEARIHKHPIFQYINQVQMDYTKAMISCCGLGNDVTGFHEEITLGDVLNTYVFPNTLFLCEISGKTLYEALKHQALFFTTDEKGHITISPKYLYPKKELYNYDIFDGVTYDIFIGKDGSHDVKHVKVNGKEIQPDDQFTIVLNSYRMSGGGNISWHQSLKVIQAFPLDITEIIIDDIKQKKNILFDIQKNVNIYIKK